MFPKSINVKGIKYKIHEDHLGSSSDGWIRGLCDSHNKIISISKFEKTIVEKIKVLAHELGHAYASEKDISMVVDLKTEELFCYTIMDVVADLIPLIVKHEKAIKKELETK